jgi:hypothetical protein
MTSGLLLLPGLLISYQSLYGKKNYFRFGKTFELKMDLWQTLVFG